MGGVYYYSIDSMGKGSRPPCPTGMVDGPRQRGGSTAVVSLSRHACRGLYCLSASQPASLPA